MIIFGVLVKMSWVLYFLVPTIFVLYMTRKYKEHKWGRCTNNVRLDGRVAIITGANSGIGFETAKELAARGARVILACRSILSGEEAVKRIKAQLQIPLKQDLLPMELDLANLQSVRKFADQVKSSFPEIHLLINNAGVSYPKGVRKLTDDGFEIHFGVNHLGHFLLTLLLLDTLKRSKSPRIIIVSSMLHEKAKLNVDDLNSERTTQPSLYACSKLANMYFCRELARRLEDSDVKVYALCPGWVYTGLFRNYNPRWYHYIAVAPIAFLFMRNARQGAQTTIYCATEPQLVKENGYFYRDCKKYTSKHNFDSEMGLQLWKKSEEMLRQKAVL